MWNNRYPYVNDEELNLDWILNKVKECIAKIDAWSVIAEELAQALQDLSNIQTRLSAVEALASSIRTELTSFEADVTTRLNTNDVQIADLYTKFNDIKAKVDTFGNEFELVYHYIDNEIAKVNRNIDSKIQTALINIYMPLTELKNRVDELEKAIANINTSVANPWRPSLGDISIKRNINYIYNDLADECLTAEQYCKLGLSAQDYTNFELTARSYSEFGKDKLNYRWVYSPAYGFKQELNNVLTSIINFIKNTLSADEYTALDIDADAYTALDLTADDYYSYNV